jgi:hypothetical protein
MFAIHRNRWRWIHCRGNAFKWTQEIVSQWNICRYLKEGVGSCWVFCDYDSHVEYGMVAGVVCDVCKRVTGWSWGVWIIIPSLSHCLAISSIAEGCFGLRIMLMASSATCNMNFKLLLRSSPVYSRSFLSSPCHRTSSGSSWTDKLLGGIAGNDVLGLLFPSFSRQFLPCSVVPTKISLNYFPPSK